MIITVSELKGEELIKNIHNGILRKLRSAKQLVNFDKEISAGLYTYALEEFGKLLLVKESKSRHNLYEVQSAWFKTHKDKFPKAFDYLQENKHGPCIILTKNGFDVNGFNWRGFMIGLPADFETRLSIFYSSMKIVKIPDVDQNLLQDAINELEKVVNNFP